MKKVVLIFMSLLIAFHLILPPDVAQANIVSKPLQIAAKKAAKDIAKDTAVEMANQIVSEYLVKELLEGVNTDKGYSAVCMDGKKDNLKDCAPDKRAQIKTDLSQTDKKNLEKKIESVLERKTNTSSKWTKFLDFFIPLFLVSGALSFISSALDGDILSFFDEIAQESLIESGLLKPLSVHLESDFINKDFTGLINYASVRHGPKHVTMVFLDLKFVGNSVLNFSLSNGYTVQKYGETTLLLVFTPTYIYVNDAREEVVPALYFSHSDPFGFEGNKHPSQLIWRGDVINSADEESKDLATSIAVNQLYNFVNTHLISKSKDINDVVNTYLNGMSMFKNLTISGAPDLPSKPPEVDYGKQTATEKIKDSDGKVKMKGINSFNFTYGDTHIYPSDQSKTGWKNKTTGEDITVVEDDVVVEDATDGTGPPDGTDEGTELDKDKEKEELEKESESLGNLVTTRFPFSLPWDFMALLKLLYAEPKTPEWKVTGTEDIPLNFTIDLKFLDPYAPWFRGFVLIGFIFSVIFMHSRFMGGSK